MSVTPQREQRFRGGHLSRLALECIRVLPAAVAAARACVARACAPGFPERTVRDDHEMINRNPKARFSA